MDTLAARIPSPLSASAPAAQETSPIGSLIRSHRLRIGLTQRELADLSTISVRAIRDLEHGKARRPRSATVQLVADALRLGPRARAALEEAAHRGRVLTDSQDLAAPPTALHAMAGREGETEVLVAELSGTGTERLITMVGLTGVGKTRLALAVAERLHGAGLPVLWHAFPGGRPEYLDLGDETTAPVAALVDDLFGAPGPGGRTGTAAASLVELVGDGATLLVLDGAPAAPPRPDRLTALLRACPGLRLLVTSDAPWRVPGERVFLVSPLEVPAPGGADAGAPALRVFLDHVRRARPDFVAGPADLERAARVCRLLDGHPGALAAAASWLVVYDLATLCHGLGADPAALLHHLGEAGVAGDLRTALHDRLSRLPADARTLLDALCAHPPAERANPGADPDQGREMAELTALTGLSLPECGRRLRELLINGVVRAEYRDGVSRFRVLGLARAAWAHPAAATAAAH
ncbi:helix-turn-helix domain-containing protein [Streptomyces sp. DH24]|uniref:helix-turn-helix domain-containing protein n=1 Tax=Streptomyces sp. DH24 TaxID=3040123 RepID=UPI00244272EA|nr:helix-turn-helix domain-containing protein [Streptomyces sp. DH24]MDG9718418.1 helix-turn-helix domain-containing protein [Streptomyces sp. DH24]